MEQEKLKTKKRMVIELILRLILGLVVFQIGIYFLLEQTSRYGNPYNEYLLITQGVMTKGVLCDYKEYHSYINDEGSSDYHYSWDYSFKVIPYDLSSLRKTLDILDEKSSIKRSSQSDNELVRKLSDSCDSYNLNGLYRLSGGEFIEKEYRSSGFSKGCWPNYPESTEILYLNNIPIINKLKYECSTSVLELLWKKFVPLSLILSIFSFIAFWIILNGITNFKRSMKIYNDALQEFRASKN